MMLKQHATHAFALNQQTGYRLSFFRATGYLIGAIAVFGLLPLRMAHAAVEQEIFGWVERVEIMSGRYTMKAKLDTGAATSSLDASNIKVFKRKGKRWVRFTVEDPGTGEPHEIERRLERHVRIIRHNGEHQRRAVVKINVCLGRTEREVEVSLIDRGEFIYSLLLGRSALENYALIDAGETFLSKPRCEYADGQDQGDDDDS